ncbi:MAG: ferrochelatase [Thermodesulfobacteriota bacterium]
MAGAGEKIGVILLNLGGPERLADVEPFLVKLFSDRQIIRLSPFPFLQRPIARFIARKRAPKSRAAYRQIGGGSPLARITGEQGQALAQELSSQADFRVVMAMRYWQPDAKAALMEMAAAGVEKIIALTLYPHYSKATSGSSLTDLKAQAEMMEHDFAIAEVAAWPEQPDYITALVRSVRQQLEQCLGEPALVYSAHSLPVKLIEGGDPYLDHLARTIAALEARLPIRGHLCFQSRSGPVRWLEPSTPDTLRDLARQGIKEVVMLPISFVSDHVETLYEIDIEYGELARELGLTLHRTQSLNCDPDFIKGLAQLTLAACRDQNWL